MLNDYFFNRFTANKTTFNKTSNKPPASKTLRINFAILSFGRLNFLKWKKITIPITAINKTAKKESNSRIIEIIFFYNH